MGIIDKLVDAIKKDLYELREKVNTIGAEWK